MQCQGKKVSGPPTFELVPCTAKATTKRKAWRFGKQGEPSIVKLWTHYCQECANMHDEIQAENAAEAAML